MGKRIRCGGAWVRNMKSNWGNTRTECRERATIMCIQGKHKISKRIKQKSKQRKVKID